MIKRSYNITEHIEAIVEKINYEVKDIIEDENNHEVDIIETENDDFEDVDVDVDVNIEPEPELSQSLAKIITKIRKIVKYFNISFTLSNL